MNNAQREIKGAVIAPLISTLILCVYLISSSSIGVIIWTFFIVGSFGFFFTFSLGLWVYKSILKKKSISSIYVYSIVGVIIGALVYVVFFLPIFISNLGYGLDHAFLMLFNNYKLLYLLALYGLITATVFWFIVIRVNKVNN